MKIAVISDIHGNLEALKTTLEDIKTRGVEKIICLGDIIAKGTHPSECLKLIRENCDTVLQGNCDKHFSTDYTEVLSSFAELEQNRIKWNQNMLLEEEKAYLQSLPFCEEFYLSGSYVRLFHAHPKANNIPVISADNFHTKFEMFEGAEKTLTDKRADIVIYGHTHQPYMETLYNKTIVNVGSVGNAFDTIRNPNKDSNVKEITRSSYVILEGNLGKTEYENEVNIQFIRVCYDIEKELEDVKENLESENYQYELRQGKYREMDKVNENFKKLGIDPNKI